MGAAPIPDSDWETGHALPGGIRLGTSSWSFPGWSEILFDRPASTSLLAREGLKVYARHPLLRAVGIDRTYYGPLPSEVFAVYATQVPETFRFLVKAPESLTLARERERFEPNPLFLDAGFAADRFVGPVLEGLGDRAGPLVFQFPPQRHAGELTPARFAERIASFLERLPKGPLYALEIRNRPWLTEGYAQALRSGPACHCLTVHPRMPGLAAQASAARISAGSALVVRWMLGGMRTYESARARYAPFNRIVDADPSTRDEIAALALEFDAAGKPVFVAVNNKAEGSAPLSVFHLARRIAERVGS